MDIVAAYTFTEHTWKLIRLYCTGIAGQLFANQFLKNLEILLSEKQFRL